MAVMNQRNSTKKSLLQCLPSQNCGLLAVAAAIGCLVNATSKLLLQLHHCHHLGCSWLLHPTAAIVIGIIQPLPQLFDLSHRCHRYWYHPTATTTIWSIPLLPPLFDPSNHRYFHWYCLLLLCAPLAGVMYSPGNAFHAPARPRTKYPTLRPHDAYASTSHQTSSWVYVAAVVTVVIHSLSVCP